jgi:helicase
LIIEIAESKDIISTEQFKFGRFSFEHFNPVQSAVFSVFDKPENCLISANTSAGKTAIAEMYIASTIRQHGGKGIYLSPMKALSQEKFDEWRSSDHHFSDLKVSICTGDYQITSDRKKELAEADIIIMTYEILNSLSRARSDKSDFLNGDVTLVIDEFHMLGDESRGSHIEVGLLNFLKLNPKARIVALSAVMPNHKEIGNWISNITGRDTYVLRSDYRPCKLNKYFTPYRDKGRYEEKEETKMKKALEIIKKNLNDKFIIFVHGKKTGLAMLKKLASEGIVAKYHTADLAKADRIKIENEFRDSDSLKVLVATSTLSAGVNTPAKGVIVLGVHRGLSEVEVSAILNSMGRAGRKGYGSDEGDAYVLLPDSKIEDWKYRINNPPDVMSSLVGKNETFKNLAFHIVSEIHHGNITNRTELNNWFKETLSHHQNLRLDSNFIYNMLDSLKKCSILKEESGTYTLTQLGKISSMYYYSPYDVSNLYFNFDHLFKNEKEQDDYWLTIALSNIDTHRCGIASRMEVDEADGYVNILRRKKVNFDMHNASVIKVGYCYHLLLQGKENPILSAPMRGLQYDFSRTLEVLSAINRMHGMWNRHMWLEQLRARINYGVPFEMVDIVKLSGIGRVKANKLWTAGLRTLKDISTNINKVKIALNCSDEIAASVVSEAKNLHYAI